MENQFKPRQFRNETRGQGAEAEAAEAGWKRVQGLYQTLLEKTKDRIATRAAIWKFVEELQHLYSEEELRTYRAYNLITSSGGAGLHLDFPDNRIQNFLDELLLAELKKSA